ncbi:hypothetical protein M5K25_026662 [Dendrobium thyrsiflorum]|uniref:Uncharacterized protein n=1 Tax=Dendrobium thyrsiflorum TaxID=117978 RepID=A0ABD0TXV3_DENTH
MAGFIPESRECQPNFRDLLRNFDGAEVYEQNLRRFGRLFDIYEILFGGSFFLGRTKFCLAAYGSSCYWEMLELLLRRFLQDLGWKEFFSFIMLQSWLNVFAIDCALLNGNCPGMFCCWLCIAYWLLVMSALSWHIVLQDCSPFLCFFLLLLDPDSIGLFD